ncbi:hypothetical protein K505DRAFT_165994 [Melanomma pulvis-pyrius CBS 109.77]|uniref:Uncharacterized protein n=1 Tax=Melanomma pulvis-pyrius CBS 109.77 TaxID=1314802 RepID=A0A6A6XIJ2_9PLEO|nr:hypothetical protein K505DRAFT_165994 [Melanomma pulvis-pyrius CBS 109.77]
MSNSVHGQYGLYARLERAGRSQQRTHCLGAADPLRDHTAPRRPRSRGSSPAAQQPSSPAALDAVRQGRPRESLPLARAPAAVLPCMHSRPRRRAGHSAVQTSARAPVRRLRRRLGGACSAKSSASVPWPCRESLVSPAALPLPLFSARASGMLHVLCTSSALNALPLGGRQSARPPTLLPPAFVRLRPHRPRLDAVARRSALTGPLPLPRYRGSLTLSPATDPSLCAHAHQLRRLQGHALFSQPQTLAAHSRQHVFSTTGRFRSVLFHLGVLRNHLGQPSRLRTLGLPPPLVSSLFEQAQPARSPHSSLHVSPPVRRVG